MKDLDIILYTSFVILLFIAFGISTFGEFRRMHGNEYTGHERKDDGQLFKRFLSKLFG